MKYWRSGLGQAKVDAKCSNPSINIDDYTTEYTTEEHRWLHGHHGGEVFITYQTMYEGLLAHSRTCCEFLRGMWGMMLGWDTAISIGHQLGEISGPRGPMFDLIGYRTRRVPPVSNYQNFKDKIHLACGDNHRDETREEMLRHRVLVFELIIRFDHWAQPTPLETILDTIQTIIIPMPIPFLAQFDLSESRDLIGDIHWDVVLIFSDADVRRGGAVAFENICAPNLLVNRCQLPVDTNIPRYSGVRWRTQAFPNWEPMDGQSWSSFEFLDGTRVDDIYFAMEPLGMQIGEHPFVPPGATVTDREEVILCSLPSIAPRSGYPHPFLNRETPLTPTEAESSSVILTDIDDDDGFGIFYVVITADRLLSLRFANL